MPASFSNLAIQLAALLQLRSKSIPSSTFTTCLISELNPVLTSGSSLPSKTYFCPYLIRTLQPNTFLDHGSQEERRCCSRSLDCPSLDSQTCPRPDLCFISAHQAPSCICEAHLGQIHSPQLVRCSRDRFGRVGSLCSGYSSACQAD